MLRRFAVNKMLLVALVWAAALLLGGCVVHEDYPRHARHRDVIVVVPEHHEHNHWR